ncbi:hypothetical protein BOSEA31B_13213 [Hyphomicrobiales bacterium]|nr:hypothetical protein BOSEA31B_13213 [Hyphomicrobiales bacterium]CAH1698987.1 hypothetical protein BOSEA1005_12040 [Hyphomicrobiales bacterium]CAI0342632.1 hypothetical protein BO1005MUT1_190145 [Hyphomicrobiales bacterium]
MGRCGMSQPERLTIDGELAKYVSNISSLENF